MRKILTERLAKFRNWSYSQLAQRVARDHRMHNCLEHVEEIASDGTRFQIEFNAFWDDKPHGDVRVIGSFSAEPQQQLLGFIPIYTPNVTNSFIMRPDGRFVEEQESPAD